MITSIIWCGIDALGFSVAELSKYSESDKHMNTESGSKHSQQITVGSSLPINTLAELEQEHGDDEA